MITKELMAITLYGIVWTDLRGRHLIDTNSAEVAAAASLHLNRQGATNILVQQCDYAVDEEAYQRLKERAGYVEAKMMEKDPEMEALLAEVAGRGPG